MIVEEAFGLGIHLQKISLAFRRSHYGLNQGRGSLVKLD